jgi:pyruvate-formate lyase-activating enzyme
MTYAGWINSLAFFKSTDGAFLENNPIANWSYEECKALIDEAVRTDMRSSEDLIAANARLAYWECSVNKTIVSSFPFNFVLPLTDVCNARCSFCAYIPERVYGHASTVEEFKRLDWLRFVKNLNINSGLGEAFMHPGFADIFEFLREWAPLLFMRLTSNGTRLIDARVRRSIVGYLDQLHISINAARPDTYRRTMKLKWEDTIEGLRLLAEDKEKAGTKLPNVTASVVMHRENIAELPELPAILRSLKINQVRIADLDPLQPDWVADNPRSHLMTPEKDSIWAVPEIAMPALRQFAEECRKHHIELLGHFTVNHANLLYGDAPKERKAAAPREAEPRAGDVANTDPARAEAARTVAKAAAPAPSAARLAEVAAKEDEIEPAFIRHKQYGVPFYCVQPYTTLRVYIQNSISPCCGFCGGLGRFDWSYASSRDFHDPRGTWNGPEFQRLREGINHPGKELKFCTGCRVPSSPEGRDIGAAAIESRMDLRSRAPARFTGRIADNEPIKEYLFRESETAEPIKVFSAKVPAYRKIVANRTFFQLGEVLLLGRNDAYMPFLAEANHSLTVVMTAASPVPMAIIDRFGLTNTEIVVTAAPEILNFEDGRFDGVWLDGALLHERDRNLMLSTASRLLRPRGLLHVCNYPTLWTQALLCAQLLVGTSTPGMRERALNRLAEGAGSTAPGNFGSGDRVAEMLSGKSFQLQKMVPNNYFGRKQQDNPLAALSSVEVAERLRRDSDFVRKLAADGTMLNGLEQYINFVCFRRPRRSRSNDASAPTANDANFAADDAVE